jgi:hypothetical protein
MSILLATTVLALGGLGLYMFKSDKPNKTDKINNKKKHTHTEYDDNYEDEVDDDYNEDGLFGSSSFFNWGSSEEEPKEDEHVDDNLEELEEDYEEEYKPRKRATKTHKNRKSTGNSRRKY